MAWVKSKSNRSFADVLKGKSSDDVLSSPSKSTESSERVSPMIIRASSSSSSNHSQSGSNREVSKTSSTASDKKSEQRLQGARSPLRLSPVTVQGIRSDHSSANDVEMVRKVSTSSTSTSTAITKTTTASTNTDLPRTPPMKKRSNAWASPFLSKKASVSSQTQTNSIDSDDDLMKKTPTPIVRVTTAGTQTGEQNKSDAGTSTYKDLGSFPTTTSDDGDDSNPKQHFDKLFEGQYKHFDAANTMKSKSPYAEGRVGGDKLESKIKAIAARSPINVDNDGGAKKPAKKHVFRATKSPFVPSFMKAGHNASGEIYKGGGSTQAEKPSYEKIYKINDGAEVKVSSQFIQRLSNEILDFENFTDDLTKMFEEHIEKCINKTKHVIFTTAKSHYTVNGLKCKSVRAPTIQVHGSFATKLWLPSSDVDMVIQGLLPVKKGGNSDKKAKNAFEMLQNATSMLQVIAAGLEKEEWVGNLMMITTSNMPVIKFYSILKKGDILYKFPFDVSIDPGTTPDVPGFTHAHTGVPAREMITHFLGVMPEFRAMMLVLKQLLRERGLNDT